jgi:hypothetical protein
MRGLFAWINKKWVGYAPEGTGGKPGMGGIANKAILLAGIESRRTAVRFGSQEFVLQPAHSCTAFSM